MKIGKAENPDVSPPTGAGFVAGTYEIPGGYAPALLCVSRNAAGEEVRNFALVKKGKVYDEAGEFKAAKIANRDLARAYRAGKNLGWHKQHKQFVKELAALGYYYQRDGSKFR